MALMVGVHHAWRFFSKQLPADLESSSHYTPEVRSCLTTHADTLKMAELKNCRCNVIPPGNKFSGHANIYLPMFGYNPKTYTF
eukprot:9806898-Karenia_brevis.AAC.1